MKPVLFRTLGIASILGLSLITACVVGEEAEELNDPNANDGLIDESDKALPEVVEEDDVTPPPTEPLAVATFAQVCNTEGLGLRQRSGPGMDQAIVRGLPEGAIVKITGEADGWRQNDWDGLEGWSSASYLCATTVEETDTPTSSVVINGWTRPLAGYRKTQAFKGWTVHNGVDLAKPYGTVVYAAHAGRVTEIIKGYCKAGYACKGTGKNWALDPKYYMSGDKIVVTHPDGLKTVYDHCGPSGLSWVGKQVYPDTPICKINATGNRSGAHLHFSVVKSGRAVDPEIYVSWL